MAADTTRLLVLGVVRIFAPANGYQLRRELLSWEVDRWANVNPGSIYSMLGSLTRQELVAKHELATDSGRPVAVYTMTDLGDAEFERMLVEAIAVAPDSGDPLGIRAAMSFAPMLGRSVFLDAVRGRIATLSSGRIEMERKVAMLSEAASIPPHVAYEFGLEFALLKAQEDWLIATAEDVEGGALEFADDAGSESHWTPIAGDPGWRMVHEREAYIAQLAELTSN